MLSNNVSSTCCHNNSHLSDFVSLFQDGIALQALVYVLPGFSNPAWGMGVRRWKLSPWATWIWSSTHCHRMHCRLTRLTSHWAYSLGGMGCGKPPLCSLKLNIGRQEGGEAWFRLGQCLQWVIMSDRHATGLRFARPWICSLWYQELIIWLMSVSFLHCANTPC